MKVRLGLLREFLREALLEQAWVPGRWDPRSGEPVDADDLQAMGETDDRMEGDGAGPSSAPEDDDVAQHLRSEEEGMSLGDQVEEGLNAAIRQYLTQEATEGGGGPTGFYAPFDMERDHSATWYRSPGQPMGAGGDPFRSEDSNAQLGFHAPGNEETASLAPPIWQLTAGSDTSKVLGAGAKPDTGSTGLDVEPEESTEEPDGIDDKEAPEGGRKAKGEGTE